MAWKHYFSFQPPKKQQAPAKGKAKPKKDGASSGGKAKKKVSKMTAI